MEDIIETKQQIKEVEEIMDDCLKEAEINEKLNAESERFKKVNEMAQQDNSTSYDRIAKELRNADKLNTLHGEILTSRSESASSEKKILDETEKNTKAIADVEEIAKNIRDKHNKQKYIEHLMFFLLGVLIGTQYLIWMPWIGQILDFVKTLGTVFK